MFLCPGRTHHWQLLSQLRQMLRTKRGVRLAVLYGSLARGEEDPDSDLDLLVSLAGDSRLASLDFAACLQGETGRRVDVAHLA